MVFHTSLNTTLSTKSILVKSSKLAHTKAALKKISSKSCGSVKPGFNYTIKGTHPSITYGSNNFSVVAKYGHNPLSGDIKVMYCPIENNPYTMIHGGGTIIF